MNQLHSSEKSLQPVGQSPPSRLPLRRRDAHKGDFGRVLVIGGSRGMAGAVAIAASAAITSGAGLVTVAVPDPCLETVAAFHPACMTRPLPADRNGHFGWAAWDQLQCHLDRNDVLAIGPGMGQKAGSQRIVRKLLQAKRERVLDADALNLLALETDWASRLVGPTILTPHPREWERLSGIAPSNREEQCVSAERIARSSGAIIVLKGSRTFVTDGKRNYENRTGNPGMASGGSGDCLTGIVGGLMAQGLSPWSAATLGVWVHGRAGDLAAEKLGEPSMTAVDLLKSLPAAISEAIAPKQVSRENPQTELDESQRGDSGSYGPQKA